MRITFLILLFLYSMNAIASLREFEGVFQHYWGKTYSGLENQPGDDVLKIQMKQNVLAVTYDGVEDFGEHDVVHFKSYIKKIKFNPMNESISFIMPPNEYYEKPVKHGKKQQSRGGGNPEARYIGTHR
jgi:hypothetical protein